MRRRGLRLLFPLLLIGAVLSGRDAFGQTTRPSSPAKKGAAIKAALKQLETEARVIIKSQRFSLESPDFASRFDEQIEASEALDAIIRPQHRDPFIDAYIRWQLTSFDTEIPDLDDRGFEKIMQQAPVMVENPRAAAELVGEFAVAEKQTPSAGESKRLREAARELDRRTEVATSFNRPAELWREWLASKFEGQTARQLHLHIESAATTIRAGWPSRTVKATLTKTFKGASSDSTLTDLDRRAIATHARTLIGLKRRSINEITFAADGSISVTFTNAAIDSDDVEKWLDAIGAGDD